MNVLPVYMYAYHINTWIPQGQNRSPGTTVIDNCELPCGSSRQVPLSHLSSPTERF